MIVYSVYEHDNNSFRLNVPAINSFSVNFFLATVAETNHDICTFGDQPGKVVGASADCHGDPLVTESIFGKC